ncbi:helix-turn-helix domain-containing protein [Nocardia sp. NPDC052112]|uniref:helix-turn-helix domain-containing protein n=1 Tax=Nocardia sp. NPDC052112 TaxID=3155646 RepID=UPI00343005A4
MTVRTDRATTSGAESQQVLLGVLRQLGARGGSPAEVVRHVTAAACTLFDVPVAWIGMTSEASPTVLQMSGWTGLAVPQLSGGWHQELGSGIGGVVAATGQSTIIRDYRRDPRRNPAFKNIVDVEKLISGIAVALPLEHPGVLYWGSRHPHVFSDADLPMAEAFAATAAAVIGGAIARHRVQQVDATFETIAQLSQRLLAGEPIRPVISWLARRLDGAVRLCGDKGAELAAHEARGNAPLQGFDLRAEQTELGRLELRGEGLGDDAARLLAEVVALDLARRREREVTALRLQADFVVELLSDAAHPAELAQRAGLLGFDLRATRAVARIGLAPEEIGHPADAIPVEVVRTLDAAVRRRPGAGPVIPIKTDVWVLLPEALCPTEIVVALLDEAAEPFDGTPQLVAGVGRVCAEPADYRRSRADAELAIQIARARQRRAMAADELKTWQLLAPASDATTLSERAEWILRPLLEADRRNDRDDLATLRAWLANDRHRARTAAALFVHENTVRYRLKRIARILDVDLQNPDSRFPIELAVRTLELLDATATS